MKLLLFTEKFCALYSLKNGNRLSVKFVLNYCLIKKIWRAIYHVKKIEKAK